MGQGSVALNNFSKLDAHCPMSIAQIKVSEHTGHFVD